MIDALHADVLPGLFIDSTLKKKMPKPIHLTMRWKFKRPPEMTPKEGLSKLFTGILISTLKMPDTIGHKEVVKDSFNVYEITKDRLVPKQLQNILKSQKKIQYLEIIERAAGKPTFSIRSDILFKEYRLQVELNYLEEEGKLVCDATISIRGIKTDIVKGIVVALIKSEFVSCRKHDQKHLN
tara:strand:- start:164 stop:709 length:546 start_codon:yes stop_codon:yes gene_type:complete